MMVGFTSSQCLRGMVVKNNNENAEVYVNLIGNKNKARNVPYYGTHKGGWRGMGFGFEEMLERTKRVFDYEGSWGEMEDGEIALGIL